MEKLMDHTLLCYWQFALAWLPYVYLAEVLRCWSWAVATICCHQIMSVTWQSLSDVVVYPIQTHHCSDVHAGLGSTCVCRLLPKTEQLHEPRAVSATPSREAMVSFCMGTHWQLCTDMNKANPKDDIQCFSKSEHWLLMGEPTSCLRSNYSLPEHWLPKAVACDCCSGNR